jgi:nucleoside-diphosphate-sugar epimerase
MSSNEKLPLKAVIFGSEGNVGRRLKPLFAEVFGIDQAPGADLVAPIKDIDFAAEPLDARLKSADVVLHFATSPNVAAPDDVQYQAVIDAARLLDACQRIPVPRVLLPSSDWAEPKVGWAGINTYGHSKRVFETMAAMYRFSTGKRCAALCIGWVALPGQYETSADWLRANYWSTERLIAEVKAALEL